MKKIECLDFNQTEKVPFKSESIKTSRTEFQKSNLTSRRKLLQIAYQNLHELLKISLNFPE